MIYLLHPPEEQAYHKMLYDQAALLPYLIGGIIMLHGSVGGY
ncbi:MAG TPA: hypothetical protein VFE04_09075 [Puia sp.]|nr:hypothetical protein [Puia sp.]